MKRYLSLIIVLVLVFSVGVSSANAQNEWADKVRDLKDKITTVREEAKQKMNTLRESLKSEKDAAKAKLAELRITGREKALERFDAAVTRLTNAESRVNEYISKLKGKDVNTAEAENFMKTVDTKLDAAKEKIAEMNSLLATSPNELTKEDKTKLRTLAQETQTLLKEAHQALRDAVKSLKNEVKNTLESKKSDKTEEGTENNNE